MLLFLGLLLEEIAYWLFLDEWDEPLPWRDERHISVTMATDASHSGWGGTIPHSGAVFGLKILKSYGQACTIMILDVYPRKYWWPLLQHHSVHVFCVATRGSSDTLLMSSKDGWKPYLDIPGDFRIFSVVFK